MNRSPLKKLSLRILLWLLFACWLWLVFFFSGQSGAESSDFSMRIAQFCSRIMGGRYSAQQLHPILRKLAHFGIFAVGGFLLQACLAVTLCGTKLGTLLSVAGIAVLAALNELHQLSAEGRVASATDVGIDITGALLGIFACLAAIHLVRRACRPTKG